jgi:hypothetical protein
VFDKFASMPSEVCRKGRVEFERWKRVKLCRSLEDTRKIAHALHRVLSIECFFKMQGHKLTQKKGDMDYKHKVGTEDKNNNSILFHMKNCVCILYVKEGRCKKESLKILHVSSG